MTDEQHERARKEINDLMQGLNNPEAFQAQVNTNNSKGNKQANAMRCLYFFQFVWIVVFAFVLNQDGNCDEPIRLFIKVLMYTFIINVLIAIAGCTTSLPSSVSILQALIHLFEFVWYIIGTVWFFQDDTCEEKWYSGYMVSLILVIFFFLSIIPYLCLCCVLVTAVGAAAATKNN